MTPDLPDKTPRHEGNPADFLGNPDETHKAPADLDYEVLRLIGQGGYGEVWLVRDRAGIYRACKVVYRESFGSDRPYEREYAGIQKFEPVSRANDSQINILHVGKREAAGYFYYIMELGDDVETGQKVDPDHYVPKTLRSEVRKNGRLPVRQCLQIGLWLTAALENLHSHGLIHRDIKPANIIFVNGIPKLADIGLVTEMDLSISYVGTEGFIPPEGPTSPQADIYGLGKVLYEICTGRDRLEFPELPADFAELTDRKLLLELNAVIAKACEPSVRKRYQSAREIHEDLALLTIGKSVKQKRAAQLRLTYAAQAGVVLIILLFALMFLFQRKSERNEITQSQSKPIIIKFPVPNASEVALKEMEIKKIFADDLAGGKAENKVKVSRELLRRSETEKDSAMQYVSLRMAGSLAIEAADFYLAIGSCEKLGEQFEVDAVQTKLNLLNQGKLYAKNARDHAHLADISLRTGFEAMALDHYNQAAEAASMATAAAAVSTKAPLISTARFLKEEMERWQAGYNPVSAAYETLRKKPADPVANLAVGMFLCFEKNEWPNGLPLLVRGNDEGIRKVAQDEILNKPLEPRSQQAMGDAWWKLAEPADEPRKANLQRRARHWYLKAIANAKSPAREELKTLLLPRIEAVTTASGEVHISGRVSGTDRVEIYPDEIRWFSGKGSSNDKINQVLVSKLKKAQAKIIPNYGATRLLSEDVDFTTAELLVNHKGRKRDKTTLEKFEDHVNVRLQDPESGSSEMEITVIFGNPRGSAN